MKIILSALFFITFLFGENSMSIYDIEVKDINGKVVSMSKYKNKVMLIVNVASKCGFTNQYEGLEELHKKHSNKGLAVLGFPCNQFLSQEPGTEEQIKEFCSLTYGVEFDMFSKIDVNGENTHPLYKFLKENSKGVLGTEAIKWNFTKFLVDKNGNVVKRYAPSTTPKEIEADIINLLK
ncbi:glutathione peroxidase [Aliarcobacter cibarius]|uniref:Glutathione peroxidase n=2 Tax=Aliarcobacter cibarius TaxID=255507 RepID=A0A5J6RFN6_9BACT|nr:glutathione peroxidase [Aliarcobacter cibarius]QKJ26885.1 glutathione peroxidase [Aliarcobacter cibarius]